MLYCNYPVYQLVEEPRGKGRVIGFRVGGEKRGECELRIIPIDAEEPLPTYSVKEAGRSTPLKSTVTVEGHTAYRAVGDTSYEMRLTRTKQKRPTVAS